jgi:hypothetical protein
MVAKAIRTHGRPTCAVEISPGEIDAGAEFTVTVRASCPDGCDLRGQGVSIRNQDDAELAMAELGEFDGEKYATSALMLRAPLEVGEHICRAVLAAHEKDGVLHEETATEFSFAAKPHATNVNAWGLPSAIAAGERFRFKVGIKCSAGCELAGRQLSVFDDEGVQVGTAGLRVDVWPGTSALYFAEVEAQAPVATGDHEWRVECPESESDLPHAAGSFSFAVKVVSPPDHEVTVEAFDIETQTPIAGAHVLLHPYRALTDENGLAKIKVAKGRYQLFVSGLQYIAYHGVIDITGDVTARAELTSEPEGQEDYR